MTQREFLDWQRFYNSHPFDDAHRFHRPAALVAGSMGGGEADAMRARLDWLRNESAPEAANDEIPREGYSAADIATMKALMGG